MNAVFGILRTILKPVEIFVLNPMTIFLRFPLHFLRLFFEQLLELVIARMFGRGVFVGSNKASARKNMHG